MEEELGRVLKNITQSLVHKQRRYYRLSDWMTHHDLLSQYQGDRDFLPGSIHFEPDHSSSGYHTVYYTKERQNKIVHHGNLV